MDLIRKFFVKGFARISDLHLFLLSKRDLLLERTAQLFLPGKFYWPSINQFNTLVSRHLPKDNGLQLWDHHRELPAALQRDIRSV